MRNQQSLTALMSIMVLGCICTATTPVIGQDDSGNEPNAALAYMHVWLQFHQGLYQKLVHIKEIDSGWRPNSELIDFISNKQRQELIDDLIRATEINFIDLQLPTDKGIHLVLPHVSYFTNSASMLAIDAFRLNEDEEYLESSRRVIALLRLSKHAQADHSFIGGRISLNILQVASTLLESLLNSNALDESVQQDILNALRSFGKEDPFGFKQSMTHMVEYGLANSAMDILRSVREDQGAFQVLILPEKTTEKTSLLQKLRVKKLLEEARRWKDDCLDAWNEPDAGPRLRAIGRAVRGGEYGELAEKSAFGLIQIWHEEQVGRATIEAMIEQIDQLMKENDQ